MRSKMIEQFAGDLAIMRPSNGQSEPDWDIFAVMGSGNGIHHPVPGSRLPTPPEAVVVGRARGMAVGQNAPWRTRAQPPAAPLAKSCFPAWLRAPTP